jgi:cyclohexanecarboxylate-CoA ligase
VLTATYPSRLAADYRRSGAWRAETIWHAFAATAARSPARTALVDGGRRADFAGLARDAERVAAGLAALGVRAGDVIAVQLPNWLETVVAFLAAARLGAVLNPILPIHRRRELGFILRESGARVLFVPGRYRDADHRALAAEVRRDTPALEEVVVVRDEPADGMRAWAALAGAGAVPDSGDATAIALLMYSSGTTAAPKGVLHSHETLLAEARSLAPMHGIGPDSTVLMPSPLTHVSGLVHAFLVPAVHGSRAVLMERWQPDEALALVAAERVTYMVGAPTFLRDLAEAPGLARHDVSSFRLFSCGGADVDPALVAAASARLGCVAKRVYGSTEFPTITTTGPDDPPARRMESDGRAIGAAELRIVDEDDRDVAPGSEGEIVARGPDCFLGYRDATLNDESFTPDGWFRTGDLGTVDAAGFLRVTGRKKDVIIRKGEKTSARELEELIALHPAVAEAAVIALPDAAVGEIACAVIRLRAGTPAPTLAEIASSLTAAGLSRRKLPERLEIADDFPRTASGKVLKRALRERYTG